MSGKVHVSLAVGVNLALEMLIQATKISAAVQAAQIRGDSTLPIEELDAIRKDRDAAFARLDQDIAGSAPAGVPIETPDDLTDGEDSGVDPSSN